MTGHAIEARVNAEDASFFPSAGPVLAARYPRGVRVDAAVETGSVVGTDYDSMIAKVIAHGPDRATALARLDRALADTAILGLTTNTGFLRTLLAHEGVRAGEMDTGLIGRLEPARAAARATSRSPAPRGDRADDAGRGRRPVRPPRRLAPRRRARAVVLDARGRRRRAARRRARRTTRRVCRRFTFAAAAAVWLAHDGWTWHVTEATAEDVHHAHADGELRAPMPGRRAAGADAVGDAVEAGQTVVVLESMKMELALAAPVDGTVTELRVSVGDKVGRDEVVAKVEAA